MLGSGVEVNLLTESPRASIMAAEPALRRSLFAVWRWPLKFQVLALAVLVILWLATMFTISQFEMFEEL